MNKRYTRHHFTLVELLIVVGIIAVLAGLVLPAVIGGIQQGRVTQAKSDLAAIMYPLVKPLDQRVAELIIRPLRLQGLVTLLDLSECSVKLVARRVGFPLYIDLLVEVSEEGLAVFKIIRIIYRR